MSKKRNYEYKDVDMVLASKTIIRNFIANLPDLSTVRTNWTIEYASAISDRIEDAMDDFLGLNKKKELRKASAKLAELQHTALRDISIFKTMIEVDFEDQAPEILKNLGYNENLQSIQKGDQEVLIQLLFSINSSLTDDLRQQLTAKGINPKLIDRILGYAIEVSKANIAQENLKKTTIGLSEEAVEAFNALYKEIMGICRIASDFYQYEPFKKEQFTFSKVVESMGASRKATEETA